MRSSSPISSGCSLRTNVAGRRPEKHQAAGRRAPRQRPHRDRLRPSGRRSRAAEWPLVYLAIVGRLQPMILQQFYLNCLAHASYLIGDEATGTAAVVDPQRDIEQYLAFAERARAAHRARVPHPLPRRLRRRPSRAARSRRRADLSRRGGEGRVRVHAARRRRPDRIRARAAAGARDARPHRRSRFRIAVYDLERSATSRTRC